MRHSVVSDIEEDLVNGASGEDEDYIDDYEDDFDEPVEVKKNNIQKHDEKYKIINYIYFRS